MNQRMFFLGLWQGSAGCFAAAAIRQRTIFLCLCCACALLMSACAGKKPSVPPAAVPQTSWPYTNTIKDLREFPQDLQVYARRAGAGRRLLSAAAQQQQDKRFNQKFFSPWDMARCSVPRKDVEGMFGRPRGYKDGRRRWTQQDWNSLRANASLAGFPTRAEAAVTVRHTSLRELPTDEGRYSEPTPDPRKNPFDNFQYSSLPLGTPVFIAHTSRDGRWNFVETALACGWVHAADLALVDEAFKQRYRSGRYVAIVRDRVPVSLPSGKFLSRTHIGAIYPLVRADKDSVEVLAPVRGPDRQALAARVRLSSLDARPKPLPLTPEEMANIGNVMLGQRYGWGGMFEDRDCSATTRDLFTPFGLWLPRNSSAQARSWHQTSLASLPLAEKEQRIRQHGVPFGSLVWMSGHIGLYLGQYNGEAAWLHNFWGVRIREADGSDGRHVLGRCVITSLQPGKELPNLYNGQTLLHRIRAISTQPDMLDTL